MDDLFDFLDEEDEENQAVASSPPPVLATSPPRRAPRIGRTTSNTDRCDSIGFSKSQEKSSSQAQQQHQSSSPISPVSPTSAARRRKVPQSTAVRSSSTEREDDHVTKKTRTEPRTSLRTQPSFSLDEAEELDIQEASEEQEQASSAPRGRGRQSTPKRARSDATAQPATRRRRVQEGEKQGEEPDSQGQQKQPPPALEEEPEDFMPIPGHRYTAIITMDLVVSTPPVQPAPRRNTLPGNATINYKTFRKVPPVYAQ